MGIIPDLTKGQLRHLKRTYRKTKDAIVKTRALIVVRLAEGASSVDIERAGICVRSTVSYVATRFRYLGELGLEDGRHMNGGNKVNDSVLVRLAELVAACPQDFGWARPTWTRELLAQQLRHDTKVRLSLATLSYCLRKLGARWGRPKPFVGCPWSQRRRRRRLGELRRVLDSLPADEIAVHEDEVDIHLNPKIGPDWMPRGVQKWVKTPGKNVKRYLAGALETRTGRVTWVEGERKRSQLFIDLVDKLAHQHPDARKIHVILDNYSIHASKITQAAVDAHGGRVVLHFLPPFCPDDNPIERLWQDLHANVTRNHRCPTMPALLSEVRRYLRKAQPYPGSKPSLRRAA